MIFLISGRTVFTQEAGSGLRFDPLLVERVVEAGQTLTYKIYLDNNNRFQPLELMLQAADIEENLRGAYQLVPAQSTPYSLARWIQIDPARLTLPPGASRSVEVNLNVPRGETGGRYGAIVITVLPEEREESEEVLGSTEFILQAASFLELIIAGTAQRLQAFPAYFTIQSSSEIPAARSRVGDRGLVFTAAIANEGNVHIYTQGDLTIRSAEGRTIGRYPLGGGRGLILPGATVELRSIIPANLPPGDYQARASIDYGGHRPAVIEAPFSIDEQEIVIRPEEQGYEGNFARFEVAPTSLELSLQSGAFKSDVLEIFNHGDETISIQGRMLPIVYDLEGNLLSEEARGEAADWISIFPDEFDVQPGRSRRIRLTASPPSDFSGGYYADIIFTSIGSEVLTETGTNLYATVGESESFEVGLEDYNVQEVGDFLLVDILLANKGKIHIQPEIEIVLNRTIPQSEGEGGEILPARTERISAVESSIYENPVLPATERIYSYQLPSGGISGEHQVLIRIDYGDEYPIIIRQNINLKGAEKGEE